MFGRTLLALTSVASFAFAGQVLVEDYTEGSVNVPVMTDYTLVEVSFTLDTNAVVLITTGGVSRYYGSSWLEDNSDSIGISTMQVQAGNYISLSRSYMKTLNKGSHTISFHFINRYDSDAPVANPMIQVLIFLPESKEAVMEIPTNPREIPKSIISTGSPVTIDGVIAVFDASGRKVENCISMDRLDVSSLNAGQYFATSEGGHTTRVTVIK